MSNISGQQTGFGTIAIAGIGDLGINILHHLQPCREMNPLLLRVNWDDCNIDASSVFTDVLLDSRRRGVSKGDPVSAAKAMSQSVNKFEKLISHVAMVLIITHPGDGIGSGGTVELASFLKRKGKPFVTITLLQDEKICGRKQRMTAKNTVTELCHMQETPVVFDQSDFPGYTDAFCKAVADKVQLLVDAMSPGMIQIDFNRIRNALCGSSRSAIATARAKGTHRARDVAVSIMMDQAVEALLNREVCVLMHLQSNGGLCLHEVEEIASYIANNWGNSVDLIYGVGNGNCENDELRLGLVVGECFDMIKQVDNETALAQVNL